MRSKLKLMCQALLFWALTVCVNAQTPAFPGAEGHGRYTRGGRGRKVVRVTTLEDNASGDPVVQGALCWALQQAGPKA